MSGEELTLNRCIGPGGRTEYAAEGLDNKGWVCFFTYFGFWAFFS